MKIDDSILQKLNGLQELQLRGATDAERKTAEALLKKLLLKYNISDQDFLSAGKSLYEFKARTALEEMLLVRIFEFMAPGTIDDATKYRGGLIKANLIYTDFVVVDSAYEYFRRHMMAQWSKYSKPFLVKCRKAKTKNIMRSKARQRFFTQYIIKSGLVQQSDLTEVELSGKDLDMAMQASNIEGGAYYTQVTGDDNNTRLLN